MINYKVIMVTYVGAEDAEAAQDIAYRSCPAGAIVDRIEEIGPVDIAEPPTDWMTPNPPCWGEGD